MSNYKKILILLLEIKLEFSITYYSKIDKYLSRVFQVYSTII